MNLRVLLVDEDPQRSALVQQALADAGHRVIARIPDDAELLQRVQEFEPDIIIIDREAPGRDTLEHLWQISRERPRPIILFSDQRDSEFIRQSIQAGVSAYIVDGLSRERVMPIVEVAIAQFRAFQALRRELEETRQRLAERTVIDRAKGILMRRQGMNEEQAYRFLRKTAMDHGRRIAEVARALISLDS